MRLARLMLPLAAVSGLFLTAAPAAAQTYGATPPAVQVSAGTVVSGNSVIFSGQGFGPNDTIAVDVTTMNGTTGAARRSAMVPVAFTVPEAAAVPQAAGRVPEIVVKTVQADAEGSFSTNVTLNGAGVAILTATGFPSGISLSASVNVLLPVGIGRPGTPGQGLPVTGNDGSTLGMILIGSAGATAGAILVIASRARRRRHTSTG